MIQDVGAGAFDNAYLADAVPAPSDVVFAVDGRCVACRVAAESGGPSIQLPTVGQLGGDPARLTYLFSLGGRACWYADARRAGNVVDGFGLVDARAMRGAGSGPKELMLGVYTAIHLGGWYRSNRFCGTCGAAMSHDGELRALRCPRCGSQVFPRLNPAVIVAVCDPVTDRIVLTRYAGGHNASIDALVAGFVEIGETLEQCVEREVLEEVGLRVSNIRYYKSQPWGIAGDVLAGFWADVAGDTTIRMNVAELARAVWARPEEVAGQPDDLSLTNEMMCAWRDARLGR